jgi:two-component system LytT family sensor kinase
MKARWKEHEIILVTVITAIISTSYVWQWVTLNTTSPTQNSALILYLFIGKILLQYLAYIGINQLIIPHLPILNGEAQKRNYFARYAAVILAIGFIAYLLGPATNFVFYYTQPARVLTGTGGIFPVHPQPLQNTFGTFDLALFAVLLYTVYAWARQAAIHSLQREGPRHVYRLTIVNGVTGLLVFVLSLPFLILIIEPDEPRSFLAAYLTFVPPVLVVFLTNMYWIFPAREKQQTSLIAIVRLLIVTALCSFLFYTIGLKINSGFFIPRVGFLPGFLICWSVMLLIISPLAWLLYQQRKDKILELSGFERALMKSSTDLQFLRSQINPHFLFNTLNTLYATALLENADRTSEGIQRLGDLMRFMLHKSNVDVIPMEKETENLKNYLSLQRLRFGSSQNVAIECNINDECCSHKIAPMLFIPLVENAFKHGISFTAKSWIKLDLLCSDKSIHFEIRNSVHPDRIQDNTEKEGGIGLKNVTDRLDLIYGPRQKFTYKKNEKEFMAKLVIEMP